ncbi:HAD hydrolase family protein [Brachybacterium kimchii]|uniref:Cof-type HAD-IIB family hydrolase n=1 Tax=Brachybacterium kimchii TaxID=2942909 RepID=A0ABY4N6M8_9MICO|nr:HAD hydrolase family protein [Brachybacterium kimchii]UQN28810.1 Cof-type HAD-IIB family hydrolase [Brachybacterium kimchii]
MPVHDIADGDGIADAEGVAYGDGVADRGGAADEPVVLDVDGTLCFDGRTLTDDIVEALLRVRARHPLVFASARPVRDLLPVLPEDFAASALIGGNGAFVRRAQSADVEVVGFPAAARALLDEIIESQSLPALVDGPWDFSFTGDEEHRIFRQLDAGGLARNLPRSALPDYAKAVLFTEDSQVIEQLRGSGLTVSVHPDEHLIDVAPSGVTKHSALHRLGILDGSYTAVGNDVNDVELLRHARRGIRVGGHPALDFAHRTVDRSEVAGALVQLDR